MFSFPVAYVPLISTADFAPVQADIQVAISSIITLVLIVAGAGYILSILWRK